MYVRAVRFTGVSAERIEQLVKNIGEAGGPPPGVESPRIQLLFDQSQETAVALQYFETAQDMQEGGQVLAAIDSAETPGTRESIDECELKLDLEA
jgi:hypothetical protein